MTFKRGWINRNLTKLKRGQPCSHHHVVSTVFSWRPFSSFSLWIILLPSDSCCFLAVRSNRLFFFLRCLRLRLVFCAIVVSSYFGATIFWRDVRLDVWPWLFAWLFRLLFHGLKVRQQLFCGFSPEKDRLWFCVHLPSSQVAHELSNQAVHELSGLAVHELSGSSGSRA